jgi:hypothetical protein
MCDYFCLYVFAGFSDDMMEAVGALAARLKPGAVVITITRPPIHPCLTTLWTAQMQQSWGPATVIVSQVSAPGILAQLPRARVAPLQPFLDADSQAGAPVTTGPVVAWGDDVTPSQSARLASSRSGVSASETLAIRIALARSEVHMKPTDPEQQAELEVYHRQATERKHRSKRQAAASSASQLVLSPTDSCNSSRSHDSDTQGRTSQSEVSPGGGYRSLDGLGHRSRSDVQHRLSGGGPPASPNSQSLLLRDAAEGRRSSAFSAGSSGRHNVHVTALTDSGGTTSPALSNASVASSPHKTHIHTIYEDMPVSASLTPSRASELVADNLVGIDEDDRFAWSTKQPAHRQMDDFAAGEVSVDRFHLDGLSSPEGQRLLAAKVRSHLTHQTQQQQQSQSVADAANNVFSTAPSGDVSVDRFHLDGLSSPEGQSLLAAKVRSHLIHQTQQQLPPQSLAESGSKVGSSALGGDVSVDRFHLDGLSSPEGQSLLAAKVRSHLTHQTQQQLPPQSLADLGSKVGSVALSGDVSIDRFHLDGLSSPEGQGLLAAKVRSHLTHQTQQQLPPQSLADSGSKVGSSALGGDVSVDRFHLDGLSSPEGQSLLAAKVRSHLMHQTQQQLPPQSLADSGSKIGNSALGGDVSVDRFHLDGLSSPEGQSLLAAKVRSHLTHQTQQQLPPQSLADTGSKIGNSALGGDVSVDRFHLDGLSSPEGQSLLAAKVRSQQHIPYQGHEVTTTAAVQHDLQSALPHVLPSGGSGSGYAGHVALIRESPARLDSSPQGGGLLAAKLRARGRVQPGSPLTKGMSATTRATASLPQPHGTMPPFAMHATDDAGYHDDLSSVQDQILLAAKARGLPNARGKSDSVDSHTSNQSKQMPGVPGTAQMMKDLLAQTVSASDRGSTGVSASAHSAAAGTDSRPGADVLAPIPTRKLSGSSNVSSPKKAESPPSKTFHDRSASLSSTGSQATEVRDVLTMLPPPLSGRLERIKSANSDSQPTNGTHIVLNPTPENADPTASLNISTQDFNDGVHHMSTVNSGYPFDTPFSNSSLPDGFTLGLDDLKPGEVLDDGLEESTQSMSQMAVESKHPAARSLLHQLQSQSSVGTPTSVGAPGFPPAITFTSSTGAGTDTSRTSQRNAIEQDARTGRVIVDLTDKFDARTGHASNKDGRRSGGSSPSDAKRSGKHTPTQVASRNAGALSPVNESLLQDADGATLPSGAPLPISGGSATASNSSASGSGSATGSSLPSSRPSSASIIKSGSRKSFGSGRPSMDANALTRLRMGSLYDDYLLDAS